MISIIVAMDDNNVIGLNNRLPWSIPEDLKLFKQHTTGKNIVMGRNTYTSLNRPMGLPNRQNIVVSRALTETKPDGSNGIIFEDNFKDVMSFGKSLSEEVFIIGGERMYEEGLAHADYLYISFVKEPADDGDTFFPEVNWDEWKQIDSEEYNKFTFKKFIRIT